MEAVEKTKYYGLVLPNVFPNGASIQSIQHTEKTSESSKDNVFLITLTNGQEIPFKIRNGTGIAKVEQTKTSLSPSGMNEITVTDTDSPAHTYTFSVKNGVGIVKMEQVKSSRAGSDTNVFRFTDSEGVEKEFTVYNGNGIAKMEQTVKSEAGSAVNTFEFTDTDGVTKAFDVTNGNGISSIEKTETDEQSGTNTLTITETNGNTTEWHVKNGTGIAKMEQTVKSDSEGDTQVFTFTDSAGNTADFEVKNGIGVEHLQAIDTTVKDYTDKMDALTADEETEGSLDNKLKTTREALQKMLDDFKSESAEKLDAMQETIDAIPFTEEGLKDAVDTANAKIGDWFDLSAGAKVGSFSKSIKVSYARYRVISPHIIYLDIQAHIELVRTLTTEEDCQLIFFPKLQAICAKDNKIREPYPSVTGYVRGTAAVWNPFVVLELGAINGKIKPNVSISSIDINVQSLFCIMGRDMTKFVLK